MQFFPIMPLVVETVRFPVCFPACVRAHLLVALGSYGLHVKRCLFHHFFQTLI